MNVTRRGQTANTPELHGKRLAGEPRPEWTQPDIFGTSGRQRGRARQREPGLGLGVAVLRRRVGIAVLGWLTQPLVLKKGVWNIYNTEWNTTTRPSQSLDGRRPAPSRHDAHRIRLLPSPALRFVVVPAYAALSLSLPLLVRRTPRPGLHQIVQPSRPLGHWRHQQRRDPSPDRICTLLVVHLQPLQHRRRVLRRHSTEVLQRRDRWQCERPLVCLRLLRRLRLDRWQFEPLRLQVERRRVRHGRLARDGVGIGVRGVPRVLPTRRARRRRRCPIVALVHGARRGDAIG